MGVGLRETTRSLFAITISALAVIFCATAQAKEVLIFDNSSLLKITTIALSEYLSDDLNNYEVAKTDLNDDGVSEYIAKTMPCEPEKQFCAYKVLGINDDQIFDLGAFEAKYLMISDQSHYGVRDILAYQNQYNDYDPTIYHWEPAQSRYILFEDASDDTRTLEK